jgi:hypothetical protein
MDAPDVEGLVCTFEDRAPALLDRLPILDGVGWLVSHQVPSGRASPPRGLADRPDVRYLRHGDAGLARNRNHCLRHARGRLCVVADDDVEFLPGWADAVRGAFESRRDCDFASFALLDGAGRPLGRYPAVALPHTPRSVFRVVSCELAFERERVLRFGIGFNERLGLGTAVGRGEEGVFLRDLVRAGAQGWSVPLAIAMHDGPTTGDRAMAALGPQQVKALGVVSYCKWGALAVPMAAKESLRLALAQRRLSRMPAFAAAFLEGVRAGREMGLAAPSPLAPG